MTVSGTYRSRNRNPPMHGYGKTLQAWSRCSCFLALALLILVLAIYNLVNMVLELGGRNLAIILQELSCWGSQLVPNVGIIPGNVFWSFLDLRKCVWDIGLSYDVPDRVQRWSVKVLVTCLSCLGFEAPLQMSEFMYVLHNFWCREAVYSPI